MMVEQQLMFKYRLYPSRKQIVRLESAFADCKYVWNELLGLNKKLRLTHKFDMNGVIIDLKLCNPDISKRVHSQVLQNVSDRLHKSFDNFFSRIKLRKKGIKVKAGFPRFKRRISSITFSQSGFKLEKNKLFVSKIGSIPIILSREIRGVVKTLTVKKNKTGQWFAVFSCNLDIGDPVHTSKVKVGIDVGLESFATLSKEDCSVPNPRFFRKSEKKLSREQRKLSRKVLGSNNRNKQRLKVARVHLRIFNQRTDFLHKLANKISHKYFHINVERLMIKNMVKNGYLAKSISDVGWGRFFNMLSYKEVILGGKLERKNPRNTSKECSNCKTLVDMPLGKRVFVCPVCGLKLHRDKNASINIELKNDTDGLSGISTPMDKRPIQQIFCSVASRLDELGTICVTRIDQ